MKLLRSLKRFGRCACPGHGQGCEVTHQIRATPKTRQAEKAEQRKVIGDWLGDDIDRNDY